MSFTKQPKSELSIEREVQRAERILCTGRNPSEATVREQFKLLVMANHPDHGGVKSEVLTMEKLQWGKKILLDYLESRNG